MTNTVRASDIATPVRVPKAAELVAAQLRGQIVRGELAEGDALPPEHELMQRFGVSRPTLREAFRVLEEKRCSASSAARGAVPASTRPTATRRHVTRGSRCSSGRNRRRRLRRALGPRPRLTHDDPRRQ